AIISHFRASSLYAISQDKQVAILQEALRTDPNAIWPLIGDLLLTPNFWPQALDKLAIETIIDTNDLLTWAENHSPQGLYILAELAMLESDTLSPVARGLLIRYGEVETIQNELIARFLTGLWAGSRTNWLKHKLALAQKWVKDDAPSVR